MPTLLRIALLIFVVGLPTLIISSILESNKADKEFVKKCEETRRPYEPLVALLDGYNRTDAHSPEQTKAAWASCNSMLQACGLEKTDAVYLPYGQVYYALDDRVNRCGYESRRAFALECAEKLLYFYRRVALTYDLDPKEQDDLLWYLWYGDCDFRRKEPTSWRLPLLEEGCGKGSATAMVYLADCYYQYRLVEKRDYDMAFSLYTRAARLGHMGAVYMLGQCYENGRGTKRNYQKAGDCYQYAYDKTKIARYAKALDELYTEQKWDKNKYSPDIFGADRKQMQKANLGKLRKEVEMCVKTDIDTVQPKLLAVSLRILLEEVVNSFIECYESDCLNDRLDEKIILLQTKGYFSKEIANKAHGIRRLGNRAAHNDAGETVTASELQTAVLSITQIVEYYGQY